MKNVKIAMTTLLSLSLVGEANAQFDYDGSDTLGPILENLLKDGFCGDINYLEGGSSAGRKAMERREQQTAPMSSNLSSDNCSNESNPSQAAIATDKILVLVNNGGRSRRPAPDDTCDTALVSDVPDYSSDAAAWAEVLQLVYGGVNGTGSATDCGSDGAGGVDANNPRVKLIKNWTSLWDDACAASDNAGKCQELRFAFRRGDNSGTTKVFKKLTGIADFCNGEQHEDNDPVRTDCSVKFFNGEAQYCPNGDLGVLQAIDVAEDYPLTERFACQNGQFKYLSSNRLPECPDGTGKFAGFLCLWPTDCQGRWGCVSDDRNKPVTAPASFDGRVYNNRLLTAIGQPIRESRLVKTQVIVDSNGDPILDANGNEQTEVVLRYNAQSLYFNGNCTGGTTGLNATQQIGCLVKNVGCSMGFSGLAAAKASAISSLPTSCGDVGFVEPVVAKVNNVDALDASADNYPLARFLYINTLTLGVTDGKFNCSEITNPEERTLCGCIFNGAGVDGDGNSVPVDLKDAVSRAGYIPLTTDPVIQPCGGLPVVGN